MTIVADASIGLKWVLGEPGSNAAEELLEKDLAAPSLWLLDAANALWRRTARRKLTAAAERLTELTKAPVASVPVEQDLPEPIRLAVRLNHPVYDCLYLALARWLGTYVVTADTRFEQAVGNHGTHVGHIRVLWPMARGTCPRVWRFTKEPALNTSCALDPVCRLAAAGKHLWARFENFMVQVRGLPKSVQRVVHLTNFNAMVGENSSYTWTEGSP